MPVSFLGHFKMGSHILVEGSKRSHTMLLLMICIFGQVFLKTLAETWYLLVVCLHTSFMFACLPSFCLSMSALTCCFLVFLHLINLWRYKPLNPPNVIEQNVLLGKKLQSSKMNTMASNLNSMVMKAWTRIGRVTWCNTMVLIILIVLETYFSMKRKYS